MVKKLVHIVTLIVVAAGLSSGQDSHPTREGQPSNVGQAAEPYALFDTRR